MEYLSVNGGNRLYGTARLHGAKNSALPILTATVLIKGKTVIYNCPDLSDVENTIRILNAVGAKAERKGNTVTVDASGSISGEVPESIMSEMRSSILFLGALSSRIKSADVHFPGGCNIGLRPIDMRLRGLAELNAVLSVNKNSIRCNMRYARPAELRLKYPSVGATENLILASVFLNG